MDPTAEGEKGQIVERLQAQLTDKVSTLHKHQAPVPKMTVGDVNQALLEMDTIYRSIPDGYFLEVELTPKAYYHLGTAMRAFSRNERTGETLRYYLDVGRRTDYDSVRPGMRVLNFTGPKGSNDKLQNLGFLEVAHKTYGTDGSLGIDDVSNMRITKSSLPLQVK